MRVKRRIDHSDTWSMIPGSTKTTTFGIVEARVTYGCDAADASTTTTTTTPTYRSFRPIEDLYFCTECQATLCEDLISVQTEISSYYDPETMDIVQQHEAKEKYQYRSDQAFECPDCKGGQGLSVVAKTDGTYTLKCGYCRWSGREHGIEANTIYPGIRDVLRRLRDGRERAALDIFHKRRDGLRAQKMSENRRRRRQQRGKKVKAVFKTPPSAPRGGTRSVSSAKSTGGVAPFDQFIRLRRPRTFEDQKIADSTSSVRAWTLSDVERVRRELEDNLRYPHAKKQSGGLSSPLAPQDSSSNIRRSPLPRGRQLRPKYTRRCKRCVANGKAGLVLKPEMDPLRGDTSFEVVNRDRGESSGSALTAIRGSWTQKQTLALEFLPRVRVARALVASLSSATSSRDDTAVVHVDIVVATPSVHKQSPVVGDVSVRFRALPRDAVPHSTTTSWCPPSSPAFASVVEVGELPDDRTIVLGSTALTAPYPLASRRVTRSAARLQEQTEKESATRRRRSADGIVTSSSSPHDSFLVRHSGTCATVRIPVRVPSDVIRTSPRLRFGLVVEAESDIPTYLIKSGRLVTRSVVVCDISAPASLGFDEGEVSRGSGD